MWSRGKLCFIIFQILYTGILRSACLYRLSELRGAINNTIVNRSMCYFQRQLRENNGAGRQRLTVMEGLSDPSHLIPLIRVLKEPPLLKTHSCQIHLKGAHLVHCVTTDQPRSDIAKTCASPVRYKWTFLSEFKLCKHSSDFILAGLVYTGLPTTDFRLVLGETTVCQVEGSQLWTQFVQIVTENRTCFL